VSIGGISSSLYCRTVALCIPATRQCFGSQNSSRAVSALSVELYY
jgi:hypothetical protein